MTLASATRSPATPRTRSSRVDDREVVGAHLAGARLVVVRVGASLDERAQLVVGPCDVGPGISSCPTHGANACVAKISRAILTACDHPLEVARVAQVVRVDQRVVGRVVAGELDRAARLRPDDAGQDADRVRVALPDDDVERHVDERDLQVGRRSRPDRTGGTAPLSERFCFGPAGPAAATRGSRPVRTWLWKFSPTPGRSTTGSTPTASSSLGIADARTAAAAWATRSRPRRR